MSHNRATSSGVSFLEPLPASALILTPTRRGASAPPNSPEQAVVPGSVSHGALPTTPPMSPMSPTPPSTRSNATFFARESKPEIEQKSHPSLRDELRYNVDENYSDDTDHSDSPRKETIRNCPQS